MAPYKRLIDKLKQNWEQQNEQKKHQLNMIQWSSLQYERPVETYHSR